jgi:hypothetical protein
VGDNCHIANIGTFHFTALRHLIFTRISVIGFG